MGGWGVGRDPLFNVGPGTSYVIPNSVRYPMRDHCVQRGIQDTVRDPDIRAAPTVGSWLSYGARNSMRDAIRGPGPRTGSLIQCGTHCGIMGVVRGPEFHAGCNTGSGTPYVIPTSVRDPLRDHGRRAGPGFPCGMQSGVWDPVRDPVFSVGPAQYPVTGLPRCRLSSSPRELWPCYPPLQARRCVETPPCHR